MSIVVVDEIENLLNTSDSIEDFEGSILKSKSILKATNFFIRYGNFTR